jgi:streptogramin lyase/predicted Ser/Thr protein kinase
MRMDRPVTDPLRIASGTEVGGYVVEELIGRGGMGEVYRAHDERLGRKVALKILVPGLAENEAFRERLLRESRLAASLDHPNVVPVYDAGEAAGTLFLAMRFVDGSDLKTLLRREGALAPEGAVAIAEQVASALDAAHERGLVHRDVKPSNVLIDQQGGREHVYLADFGLTQSASDRGPAEGRLMATVDYVAPEQIRGGDVDGRADVYALGCLLFETLTGTLPFADASGVAVLYAHLEEEPPRASERTTVLPDAVDDVLIRAMAKEPNERQATCRELVEEVRDSLGLEPVRRSRRFAVAAAALIVVLVALAVATVVFTFGNDAQAQGPHGSVVRIDPTSGDVTSTSRVSAYPSAVVVSRDRVWVGDYRDGSLWRIDAATGATERFTTTGEPRDVAALAGKVYVATDGETEGDSRVTRYDAVTGNREAGTRVYSCSVGAGDGVVWVAGCPSISRLSTGSGQLKVIRTASIPFQQPRSAETHRWSMRDMAVGEGALWIVGDAADHRVFRVDPATGRVLGITALPFAPRSIAVGEGGVWVTGGIADVLGRIDPETGKLAMTITVPRGASGVGAGLGAVWVAGALDGSVSRIDPRSGAVVDTIHVDGIPREVAVGAGGVWVTTNEE